MPSLLGCLVSLSSWSSMAQAPRTQLMHTPISCINISLGSHTSRSFTSWLSIVLDTAGRRAARRRSRPFRSRCSRKYWWLWSIRATSLCWVTRKEELLSSMQSSSNPQSLIFWWWIDQSAETSSASEAFPFRLCWSMTYKTTGTRSGKGSYSTNSWKTHNFTPTKTPHTNSGCLTTSGRQCWTSSPNSSRCRGSTIWTSRASARISHTLRKSQRANRRGR